MSTRQNTPSSHNEEIDIRQLIAVFNRFFKRIVRAIFAIILFYKRKAILFVSLLVIGIVTGYFWDNTNGGKRYSKEMIIEPNFESTTYLYDFVEHFDDNTRKSLGVKEEDFKNLSGISIEPIIDNTNILDYFKFEYEENGSYHILDILKSDNKDFEKLIKYYKLHKITLNFNGHSEDNKKQVSLFLDLLKANSYYKKKQDFVISELKKNIEENEKSIKFINEYVGRIAKYSAGETEDHKNTIIYANEDKIPTVTSLLKQKEELLIELTKNKEALNLKFDLFTVVYNGPLLASKSFSNRKKIIFPIFLLGLTSVFFFFIFFSKAMKEYVAK